MYGEQDRSTAAPDMYRTARSSVICGIMMLAAWVLPLLGMPLGIAGLPSSRRDLARAGIFLNGIGLFFTALNMFLGIYLLLTGKLDLLFTLP